MTYIVTEITETNRKIIFETTSRTEAIATAKAHTCKTKKTTAFLHEKGTNVYQYKDLKKKYLIYGKEDKML